MQVFDSVLLDVYRTRLYLSLLILGVIFILSPQFRAGVGKMTKIFSGFNTVTMAVVLFVMTLLLSILVCYDGKSWGGDFSQYFAQTRALANHSIEEWYVKNIFIITTSAEGIGSDVYPWFWSILLLPMYKLFGFNIPLLKFYEAVYFAAAMIPFVFILRRRMEAKPAFLLCLGIAFNLTFLMDVNTIESDLPSMFIILLTLNVIDLYHRKNGDIWGKFVLGILVGILLFAACETKTMNQGLLLALMVYDVLMIIGALVKYLRWGKNRDTTLTAYLSQGMVMCMPFISYAVIACVFYTYLPKSGGTYNDYFKFTIGRLKDNITDYFEILGGLVCATSRPIIAIISYTIAVILLILALIGMISKLREELYLIIYMGGTMCMLFFYDYMGARFVFAIYALLWLFSYFGYVWLKEKFMESEWLDKVVILFKDGYFLYMVILLVSFCTVAFFVQTGRYSLRQADSVQAEEFYEYVNTNISDDAVIYFFKPRVLYLYTNVYSYNWYNETDHMEMADYIAVCEDDGYDRVHVYAEKAGTLVYENELFRLYEMR